MSKPEQPTDAKQQQWREINLGHWPPAPATIVIHHSSGGRLTLGHCGSRSTIDSRRGRSTLGQCSRTPATSAHGPAPRAIVPYTHCTTAMCCVALNYRKVPYCNVLYCCTALVLHCAEARCTALPPNSAITTLRRGTTLLYRAVLCCTVLHAAKLHTYELCTASTVSQPTRERRSTSDH